MIQPYSKREISAFWEDTLIKSEFEWCFLYFIRSGRVISLAAHLYPPPIRLRKGISIRKYIEF